MITYIKKEIPRLFNTTTTQKLKLLFAFSPFQLGGIPGNRPEKHLYSVKYILDATLCDSIAQVSVHMFPSQVCMLFFQITEGATIQFIKVPSQKFGQSRHNSVIFMDSIQHFTYVCASNSLLLQSLQNIIELCKIRWAYKTKFPLGHFGRCNKFNNLTD